MAAGVRFTAERSRVPIRSCPDLDGPTLSHLQAGDDVVAANVFIAEGIEWVRLAKGSKATRTNGSRNEVSLNLREDGFVPTMDPDGGTLLRKHAQVKVEEKREEGALTKAEIREILDKSSDPNMSLPLESKYWARQQLEMFVMSGGTIRPRWCSMPDERLMANTNMSKEDIMRALSQAAEWISQADAILIGSGAGMGVDSGLGTFRGGQKGVWAGLEAVGLAYEEICHPKWFVDEPHLGWAFWAFCHQAYQGTVPHDGYAHVREWGQRSPLGYFSFTSNIDSHWILSGASSDKVLEVHGAVRWLQCAKPCCVDVWRAPKDLGLAEDPVSHRVRGVLPTCPKCKGMARPNVQMFGGDSGFSKARRAAQFTKYDAWLKSMEARPDKDSLRITCFEVGSGLTVPTVRKELEGVMHKFPGARLIRVNPENPGISQDMASRGVSLPLRAGLAIEELRKQVTSDEALVTYIVWGTGSGVEVRAPFGTSLGRLLRLAGMEQGVTVEFTKDAKARIDDLLGKSQTIGLDESPPANAFREVHVPCSSPPEQQVTCVLQVQCAFKVEGDWPFNKALLLRIDQVSKLLDEMNELFDKPEYQQEVRKCTDKRSVMRLAKTVHFQVLPKYGIEGTERGTAVMGSFIGSAQSFPSIGEKVDKSMDLSFVKHMYHLPNVDRPPKTGQSGATGDEDSRGGAPAFMPPARASEHHIQVIVTALDAGGDASGDTFPVDATSATTVGELRRRLGEALSWDNETLGRAKFTGQDARGTQRALEDGHLVERVVYVQGAPLVKPPEPVEVTFTEMPNDDDREPQTFKLQANSNHRTSELRAMLAEVLGWDAKTAKQAKFLIKLRGSFGGLKEGERLNQRKVIYVHGAPLRGEAGAGQASAGAAASGAGAAAKPSASAAAREPAQADHPAPGWTRHPHCDLTGQDAENMDASDLALVRKRVERMGWSGFALWDGKAYIKAAQKPLAKADLAFKGNQNLVEFHLYAPQGPPRPSGVAAMGIEEALALQRELLKGFGDPAFQRKLADLRRTLVPGSVRKFNAEKSKMVLGVQMPILPRYGFEAGMKGVMEMMGCLGAPELQSNPEFQQNGVRFNALLEAGGDGDASQASPEAPKREEFPVEDAELTITVHIDKTLGFKVPMKVKKGSTVSSLKALLAAGDQSGKTNPNHFLLAPLGQPQKTMADDDRLAQPCELEVLWLEAAGGGATGSTQAAAASAQAPAKSAEPASVPMKVRVVHMGTIEDDEPLAVSLDCGSRTRIGDFRQQLAEACGLDEKAARRMKLLRRVDRNGSSGFVTLVDKDLVAAELFAHGIERSSFPSKS